MRALIFILALLLLTACQSDLPPGAQRIQLDRPLYTSEGITRHLYYKLVDTTYWKNALAAADTIHREGNYLKFRSNKIWYEATWVKDEWRNEFHLPGFERAIDSVEVDGAIVYGRNFQSLLGDIRVADVELGGDSVQIGLIHVAGKTFPWQRFDMGSANYLVLNYAGTDTVPIHLDQSNVGPVTQQTVFQVGRRTYAVTNINDSLNELVVQPVKTTRDLSVTAQLEVQYRPISVKDSTGALTTIRQEPGRRLVLVFATTHPRGMEMLEKLDSAYHALPAEERAATDVRAIMNYTTPENLARELSKIKFNLPIYLTTEKTCARLVCLPYYPHFMAVDKNGRFERYWGRLDNVFD